MFVKVNLTLTIFTFFFYESRVWMHKNQRWSLSW